MTLDLSRPFQITRAISINGICFDGVVSVGEAIGNIPPAWADQIPLDVVYQAPLPEPVCPMPEPMAETWVEAQEDGEDAVFDATEDGE